MNGPTGSFGAAMQAIPDGLTEELRFAVVLNGGVSLAIWMGGVTHELHRLTRRSGRVYGLLLDWAMSTARVDVISGTSAGGINGAALALAQCNERDAGSRLSQLRELWLDNGSIQNLLRQPFQGAPTSLLQGDDFFLPQINQALRQLTHPYQPKSVDEQPMDLTITTTLLRGVPGVVVDSAGQQVGQVRHDGLFRFRRGPTHPQRRDDFAPVDETSGRGDVVDALALAARSTASYPVAFEPSFIPASDELAGKAGDLHPNVARYLSGAWDQSQDQHKRARYGADGGALANTPTRPAMEAIDTMPVGERGLVRRAMLLVHPHAPPIRPDTDDKAAEPPTLVQTGASLVAAMRSEAGRNLVDLVERHNQQAGGRRDLRADLVRLRDGSAALQERARGVYVLYRRLRLRRMARELTTIWLDRPRAVTAAADPTSERVGAVLQRVLSALEDESRELASAATTPAGGPEEPFLPPAAAEPSPDVGDDAPATVGGPTADEAPDDGLPDPGQLGVEAAIGIADAAVDYLRRAMWHVAITDGPSEQLQNLRTEVSRARKLVSGHRSALLGIQDRYLAGLRGDLAEHVSQGDQVDLGDWSTQALRAEAALSSDLAPPLRGIAEAVLRARLMPPVDTPDSALAGFASVLFESEPSREELLDRLTWLEVLTAVVSGENTSGGSLPISLVQLTFQVPHPFAPPLMTGEQKVAGDMMARFSGFLKRSWRLNDWIWGRLDASRVLCHTVLDAARVRRYVDLQAAAGVSPDRLARQALELAVADASMRGDAEVEPAPTGAAPAQDDRERLDAAAVALKLPTIEALRKELSELAMAPPDARLDALVELPKVFATALALEVAADELPLLPATVQEDLREGANQRSRGTLSVDRAKEIYLRAGQRDTTAAEQWEGLERFATSGIGQETLASEATSDSLIQTAATAAANTVTMLDSPGSGLTALKPLTRTLRGAALLPYWAVRGLAGGSTLARSLAQLTLALGGVLVVLGLLGAAPTWATTAGIGAVLIAFAYGALRSGTILHSVVLLVPGLIVLAFTLIEVADTTEAAAGRREQSAVVVVAAVALVLGLFILGTLRPPVEPPWSWARRRLWAAVSALMVVLVGVVVLLWLQPLAIRDVVLGVVGAAVPWLQDRWWVMPRGVVVLAVLSLIGVAVVLIMARRLRLLAPVTTGAETAWKSPPSTSTHVATAGWSWVYGFAAAALAVALLHRADAVTDRTAIVVLALLLAALLLQVVVPGWVLLRWSAHMRRRARAVLVARGLVSGAGQRDKAKVLFHTGLNHRYLVTTESDTAPPATLDQLTLSDSGARHLGDDALERTRKQLAT